jgi:hypothetical protein
VSSSSRHQILQNKRATHLPWTHNDAQINMRSMSVAAGFISSASWRVQHTYVTFVVVHTKQIAAH